MTLLAASRLWNPIASATCAWRLSRGAGRVFAGGSDQEDGSKASNSLPKPAIRAGVAHHATNLDLTDGIRNMGIYRAMMMLEPGVYALIPARVVVPRLHSFKRPKRGSAHDQ